MSTPPAVDLPTFKKHLNLSGTSSQDDTELQLHLDAATEAIETRIGPIITREFTERVTGRNGRLVLNHGLVVSVTSVTETVSGRTWDTTLLDIDPSGVIRLLSGGRLPHIQYDVVYTAGRGTEAAARHKLAILIVAEQLWQTQRGSGARPAMFGVATSESASSAHDAQYVYRGFALPRRALELIAGDEEVAFA